MLDCFGVDKFILRLLVHVLDENYAAGFEDFRLDAVEHFPNTDFSVIKLNLGAATSSLLQTSSEDVNIEDDASTLPPPA